MRTTSSTGWVASIMGSAVLGLVAVASAEESTAPRYRECTTCHPNGTPCETFFCFHATQTCAGDHGTYPADHPTNPNQAWVRGSCGPAPA